MKRNQWIRMIGLLVFVLSSIMPGYSQTKIAKEQIEDAFLWKTGGPVYGDLEAATSTLKAATLQVVDQKNIFQIHLEDPLAVIRSNVDLVLDPTDNGTARAKIIPATVMEFPDFLGDKIRLYSQSYTIGVSPFDLDITSDRNIKFHSDTVPDLMMILGDQGDVQVKQDIQAGRDVIAGNRFKFTQDTTGDKVLLYGTLYRLSISAQTLDFYSDLNFKWHSDTHANAMQLDADTGHLTLSGPLKLPVYLSLPTGEVGDLVYLDHPSDDNQDGLYVRCSGGWQKCN